MGVRARVGSRVWWLWAAGWAAACGDPSPDGSGSSTEPTTGWAISDCTDPGCQEDEVCVEDRCVPADGGSSSGSGSSGSSSGGGGSSSDDGGDSSTGAPGCYLFSGRDCSAAVQPNLACGSPDACSELELAAGQPFDDTVSECITDGLRDRAVGTYRVHYTIELSSTHLQIEVLGDGTAIARRRSVGDFACGYDERWTGLAEPAYFDGCLAATEGEAMYACLDGLAGDSACVMASSCPPG